MKKTSLTQALFVAGVVAMAGAAQAGGLSYGELRSDASPGSTLSSDMSLSSDATVSPEATVSSADSSIDTSVLGAGSSSLSSSTTTTTTVNAPRLVYVQPSIDWDRSTALTQMGSNAHLHGKVVSNAQTRNTFDLPQRAGEASTMTGGAPNMLTDNEHLVVGSYRIPHTSVTGDYYVFSW